MERILLIHPKPDELTSALQDSGFHVVTAADEPQSMAEINRMEPDIIVMVEAIAKINGDKPCIRIRERCKAPIIILGQHREEQAGTLLLESGADVYIASPLDSELLLAWIHSLLRRSRRANLHNYGSGPLAL